MLDVSSSPVAQRLFRTVGESPAAERVAGAQEALYRPLLAWAVRSPLHTDRLGHSVHPPLTDVTLGCWLGASVLDALGGEDGQRSAALLVASGLVASAPTAIAGAGDWATMSGSDRRIGAVHALGTDVATFFFVGSLVARLRGQHASGARLAVAGHVAMAGAGLLGGHLALVRGTANRSAPDVR